jgi:hypothetical protein
LGRVYRELNELVNPPSVSQEEYEKAQGQIEALEARVNELQERREQDQQTIEQLVLQMADQDRKLAEVLDILRKSGLDQDRKQIPRWEKLRNGLWRLIVALVGADAFVGSIRDAWVADVLYPKLETMPDVQRKRPGIRVPLTFAILSETFYLLALEVLDHTSSYFIWSLGLLLTIIFYRPAVISVFNFS